MSSVVYLLTLCPGIFAWDSAELTLGVYTQGIVHATGYPVYLILGRLFTLIPVGNVAFRLNLFSALCMAFALAMLSELIYRLVGAQSLIAGASALLFGFAGVIWENAVVAEVYALHLALIILILWSALNWDIVRRPIFVLGTVILLCLALGNHMSSLLAGIAVGLYLLFRKVPLRTLCLAGLGVFIGTTVLYLYLPLRFGAASFNLVATYFSRDLRTPSDLVWMVRGGMFGQDMFAFSPLDWVGQVFTFILELWRNYLGAGLLFGLIGLVKLFQRARRLAILFTGVFLLQVVFFTGYAVFDKWQMFHTAYLIWAIFVGAGIDGIRTQSDPRWSRFVTAIAVGLVVVQVVANWSANDRRTTYDVGRQSENLMDSMPDGAMLVGPWTTLRPIEYLQRVEHRRPDLRMLDFTMLALGVRDSLTSSATGEMLQDAVYRVLKCRIREAAGPVFVVNTNVLNPLDFEISQIRPFLSRVVPLYGPCD